MTQKPRPMEPVARSAAILLKITQLMAKLEISALPRNYELLYEALTGENGALGREITALGKAADQAALDAIGVRHGLAGHNALAAGQATGEALQLIGDFAAESGKETRRKAEALHEAGRLADRMKEDPVLAISDFAADANRLLSALQDAIRSETTFGSRLQPLVDQLDGLRAGMAASHAALTHDPVTGLANRAVLVNRLKSLYEAEKQPESALVLVRVDRLKSLADSHSPGATEKALKDITAIFRKSTKKHDFVARTGADTFAFLFPDVGRSNAVTIAGRIRDRIKETQFNLGGRALGPGTLSLSAGIALVAGAASAIELFAQAEQALVAAAEAGGGETASYSPELSARMRRTYSRAVA